MRIPGRYRRRGTVGEIVTALQMVTPSDAVEGANWCGGTYVAVPNLPVPDPTRRPPVEDCVLVPTGGGGISTLAGHGDWIIYDGWGNWSVLTGPAFAEAYERAGWSHAGGDC